MAFRLKQGGEAAEPGKMEDFKQEEEVFSANKKGPWFQEKKGSVFPVKKKLVKTMMAECLAKSFSSLSISPEVSLPSKLQGGSSKMSTTPSKSSRGKKSVEIFPESNAES